jgi:hypothetical protein
MKTQMCLTGFSLWRAVEKIFQIHPYFFPLKYACTDEGSDAFAYETG